MTICQGGDWVLARKEQDRSREFYRTLINGEVVVERVPEGVDVPEG